MEKCERNHVNISGIFKHPLSQVWDFLTWVHPIEQTWAENPNWSIGPTKSWLHWRWMCHWMGCIWLWSPYYWDHCHGWVLSGQNSPRFPLWLQDKRTWGQTFLIQSFFILKKNVNVKKIIWFKTKKILPSRGRYFSFWASVPYALIGCMTSDDWTLMTERYPLSTLSTSLAIKP